MKMWAADDVRSGKIMYLRIYIHEPLKPSKITASAMYDPNSSYNTAIASQIVECIAACVKTKGLQSALEDFEGMQNILSSLHIWNLVKQGADAIFADERKRLEELELARAKASAPSVYQIMPSAQNGINMNDPTFGGAMYDVRDNDKVNIGGKPDG